MSIDVVDRLRGIAKSDYLYYSSAELQSMRESLRTARDESFSEMEKLGSMARPGSRPFTKTQQSDLDAAERRTSDAGLFLESVEDALIHKTVSPSPELYDGGVRWTRGDGSCEPVDSWSMAVGSRDPYKENRALTRTQSVTGFTRSRSDVPTHHEQLDLGKYLTGMVTGRWDSGSEMERRALSEGVQSAGGFLVPTILSSQIIDLARPETQVLNAGA